MQRRRFDITIASGPGRSGFTGGKAARFKAIVAAIIVIPVLCAILVMGVALGTALAIFAATLVIGALAVLVVRNAFWRGRYRR